MYPKTSLHNSNVRLRSLYYDDDDDAQAFLPCTLIIYYYYFRFTKCKSLLQRNYTVNADGPAFAKYLWTLIRRWVPLYLHEIIYFIFYCPLNLLTFSDVGSHFPLNFYNYLVTSNHPFFIPNIPSTVFYSIHHFLFILLLQG